MSFTLEDQLKNLKEESQMYKEALEEVRACIDSFYDSDSPRRLYPELVKYAGLIHIMDKVAYEALKQGSG